MNEARHAGLILAGGMGRRMAGQMGTCDKPLLILRGRPILDRLIAVLRPQCPLLAISANGDPERYAQWNLPVLADDVEGIGPLAGLLRGLDWAKQQQADCLLTVPGDTPFIPRDLLQSLLPAPAVAVSNGQRHHLVATWPISCRDLLRERIAAARREPGTIAMNVRSFAEVIGVRDVAFETGACDPFFNVNTPEDYRLAEDLLSREEREDHAEPRQRQ